MLIPTPKENNMISKLSNRIQIRNTKSNLSKILDLTKFTVQDRIKLFEFYAQHDSFEIIFNTNEKGTK